MQRRGVSPEGGSARLFQSPLLETIPRVRHLLIGRGGGAGAPDPFAHGKIVPLRQVHGTHVLLVDEGNPPPEEAVDADGAVTGLEGIVLRVRVADCIPLFLADREGRRIGLVHAGWRGLAGGIVAAAVRRLARIGVAPDSLVAWVGPAIGPCCYEVGPEVVRAFGEGAPARPTRGGKFLLDLPEAARRDLLAEGVPAPQIDISGTCTRCNADRLHSHRGRGGGGRNIAWITRLS